MSRNSHHVVVGNLADDPEMRFTAQGQAVTQFRMAVSDRYMDKSTKEWKDTDPSWYTVICWRDLAEHVAETFTRGTRAIVVGDMRQRSYENKEGDTVYVWELIADEVGPSLTYATAKIAKVEREKAPAKAAPKRTTRARKPVDDDEPPF